MDQPNIEIGTLSYAFLLSYSRSPPFQGHTLPLETVLILSIVTLNSFHIQKILIYGDTKQVQHDIFIVPLLRHSLGAGGQEGS
jgi:hypothetical protein